MKLSVIFILLLLAACSSDYANVQQYTDNIKKYSVVSIGPDHFDKADCKVPQSRASTCKTDQEYVTLKLKNGNNKTIKCSELDILPKCGIDIIETALYKNGACPNGYTSINRQRDVQGNIRIFKLICK